MRWRGEAVQSSALGRGEVDDRLPRHAERVRRAPTSPRDRWRVPGLRCARRCEEGTAHSRIEGRDRRSASRTSRATRSPGRRRAGLCHPQAQAQLRLSSLRAAPRLEDGQSEAAACANCALCRRGLELNSSSNSFKGCNGVVDHRSLVEVDNQEGTMARAIWKGSLSFGSSTCVASIRHQDKTIHFNSSKRHVGRIRYKRLTSDGEVDYARIVKGSTSAGEFAILTRRTRRSGAEKSPHRYRGFRRPRDIDPITTARPTSRSGGDAARRAYALLRKAMQESNKVGIATSSCATRSTRASAETSIALETMYSPTSPPPSESPNLSDVVTAKTRHGPVAIDCWPRTSIDQVPRDTAQVEELVGQAPGRVIETALAGALEQRRRPARSAPSERRGRRAAPASDDKPQQVRTLQAVHRCVQAPARQGEA